MNDRAVSGGGDAVLPLSLRFAALLSALAIYAVLGAPAPDVVGPVEGIIGGLFVFSIGLASAWRTLDPVRKTGWERAAVLLLLYGLTVPVFTGLAAGNSVGGMVRDIAAFLFFLLPLFLTPLCGGYRSRVVVLTAFTAVLGLAFSLRVLWPVLLTPGVPVSDPLLLANAPTVLFSALLLAGTGGWFLYRGHIFSGVALGAAALIPLLAMALITQRASIGVFCLALAVLVAVGFVRRPLRVLLPLLVLAAAALAFWPLIQDVAISLSRKTALVGLNRRGDEALAVLRVLDDSPMTVLFGKGWGAVVASPAVAGATVNFTHSLFTTYWLKSGLAGVSFVAVYLGYFAFMLLRIFMRFPVVALALAGPFLIDSFLYASFKSLDFGLVLLLVSLWSGYAERLQTCGFYSSDETSPE